MVRLTKGETNELLSRISEDNLVYGLIFKLIYIYGKDGMSVLSLKWDDIDLTNNTIWFKEHEFPLSRFVRDDFVYLESTGTGRYIFLDGVDDIDKGIDILRKKLRYYLANNVKRLDVSHKVKHVFLSITDLRRLRGQHLFLDGVGLDLIKELYLQGEGTVTQFKRYLEYDDLLGSLFPCSDMGELFGVYTDLGVFDFESSIDKVRSFAVSCGDVDFVVCFDGDGLGFVGDVDSVLKDKVLDLFDGGLLGSLFLLGDSEYLVVGGFSFVKL